MSEAKTFHASEHLQRIQGKDYLPVRWRLVWFHQDTSPRAGYVTKELEYDRQAGFAKYFTIAWNGDGEDWRHISLNGIELDVCGRVATGEGSETRADFTDYAEKAATKSLGRALAGLGYGTQFAPEMDEKQRMVDSPTERQQPQKPAQPTLVQEPAQSKAVNDQGVPSTPQQHDSLRKLGAALGREVPALGAVSFVQASELLRQWAKEYNEQRKQAS